MATNSHRLSKVGLAAGFLGLLVAVVVAHRAPATGYELSIYSGTPTAVWVGLGVAMAVGTVLSLLGPRASRIYHGALLLVGSTALAMLSLPIIRGYEFYGRGDALSHLGWAREIAAGTLDPANLLYPGIHTMTIFVQSVAGVPITRANLYVVLLVFPLLFLLFVPLSVRLLGGGSRALAIGLLAAALFIPVNNVSVHPNAHPATQGIFFFSFVLYLLLAYTVDPSSERQTTDQRTAVADGGRRSSWWRDPESGVTGAGVLLATASVAIVLVHPQQAVNVTLAFLAITFVQLGYRRRKPDHPIAAHRAITIPTLVLVAAVLAWAPRFDRVTGTIVALIGGLFRTGATTGEVVTQKSASLTTVGGSLPTLFVKLFLPALVFSLLATWLILVALRRLAEAPSLNSLVAYIAVGLVPLFGIFLLMVIVQSGDQYFRYVGFIMVPVTVLGAAALSRWLNGLGGSSRPVGAVALVVLMLVLLPVGVAATHPSPHIYQPNSQVTESEFSGFESTFEHRQEEVAFTGVRGGPRRFVDFHYGTERAMNTLDFPGYRSPLGEQIFVKANYSDAFEEPRYMAVTESTYEREVTLYDGFRYPERSFEALEATPSVNRVRSSDGFDLYRIDGDEDDA
ncbi:hypothetical protein [Halobacterium wangiae]|uniref:hypothetical protein n=1 Tax=Halobacterium wangiae TaxID=2902623 RepID=UPI001E65188B|nr:hypothetical protein [Halobacterium wangiae]